MQKYILAIFFSIPLFVTAQQELGLHFMRPTYQSNITNPAFFMKQTVAICMPSPYLNYGNSAFSQRNVVSQDSIIDFNEAGSNVKDYNYLAASANIMPLAVGVRIKNLQIGLTTGFRAFTYLGYNKNMFTLLTQGNAGFIGQKVNIAPDFQVNTFAEVGLSAAYRFLDERLSVGVRAKYLLGIADISTSKANKEMSVYTNPDIYQLQFTTNYQVNSSLMGVNINNLDSLGNFSPQFSGKNNGIAFDLGAEFKINDKISVAASVIDLGGITWRDNARSYTSKGTYTYEGVDAAALVLQDSSISFNAISDTLRKVFNFQGDTEGAYKTPLHSQFYLSASYRPISILTVGGLFYGEFLYGKLHPSVAVSGNIALKKWFSVGLVAAYRNKHLMPPGLNFSLGGGPVQVFFATDNIVGTFMPLKTRDYNVRTGFNWLLGYSDK